MSHLMVKPGVSRIALQSGECCPHAGTTRREGLGISNLVQDAQAGPRLNRRGITSVQYSC
jgi:hypothetical protein